MGKRAKLRLDRTLGPVIIRWIETNLCHGPGDVQGQRIEHDDEEALFIMRCYELDDAGRRVVRRAVLSWPKGRRKSEIAAELACAEALGPVRFAGWDSQGRPTGMPITSPLIRCAATEEGQADNTYSKVEFMLREGAISLKKGLDVGLTRTFLPDGGKIVPITARASSKDGGLETFVAFDETHLYVTPELRRLFETIRRNLGKRKIAEPWSLETSTMYAPGEDSVAESSHKYAEAIEGGAISDPSFYFHHRQGPAKFDFDDDDQLRAAIRQAYGPAADWMDIERLVQEARDPQADRSDFMRYFVNVPTERSAAKWIPDEAWRACQSATKIPDGATVTVAVDAAHTRDTTGCVWTTEADGRIVQRSRVWSVHENKPHDVFVPGGRLDNDLVRDFILENLAGRFTVQLVLGDPHYFDDQMQELADHGYLTVEMAQGSTDMLDAWDLYHRLIFGKGPVLAVARVDDEGGWVYQQHAGNAVGVKTERGWKVSKKNAAAPHDAVTAGAMSAWGHRHAQELLNNAGGGVVYA
jgi:phage terminase large subunit-like protein